MASVATAALGEDTATNARAPGELGALEREVVEERLVHFAERRGGIAGLSIRGSDVPRLTWSRSSFAVG